MNAMNPNQFRPTSGDRLSMVVFMLLGAVVVAISAAQMFARIAVVRAGVDVPMLVNFAGDAPATTIGDTAETLQLESATIVVPQLPEQAAGPAVFQALIVFGTVVAVVLCLVLLTVELLRGRIFSRRNTALLATIGMVWLVGSGVAAALGGVASVEALGAVSHGQALALFVLDPGPYVIGAFAFSVILTAFTVGARIQRDTEGLV